MANENKGHGWIFEKYKVIKADMPVERYGITWRCGDGCCSDGEYQACESYAEVGTMFSVRNDYICEEGEDNNDEKVSSSHSCQWYIENGWIEPVFD